MGSEIDVVQAKISKLEAKLDAGNVPEALEIAIRNEIVELRKKENILLQGGPVFRLLFENSSCLVLVPFAGVYTPYRTFFASK